jgi:hypothetical protein
MQVVAAAAWGFLVGFVGWGACFRLAEPIAGWLLESGASDGVAVGISRVVVTLFLIAATMLALCGVPLLSSGAGAGAIRPGSVEWRHLFGASFVGSFLGLFALGLLRRVGTR